MTLGEALAGPGAVLTWFIVMSATGVMNTERTGKKEKAASECIRWTTAGQYLFMYGMRRTFLEF